MRDVTVDTGALWRALKIAVPHAAVNDEVPELEYVQCRFASNRLEVTATNRFTAIVTHVPVSESSTGEAGAFWLHRDDVKDLTALFRPGKDLMPGQQDLRISWTSREVTVTDVAGLFSGKSATWPSSEMDKFPRVSAVVGSAVHAIGHMTPAGAALLNAGLLGLFVQSAKFGDAPIVVREQKTGEDKARLVITCGDAFAGVLTAATASVHELDEQTTTAWQDLPAGVDTHVTRIGE